MRPVFKDKKLQDKFDKYGYVQIPFLSPEGVEKLKNAYFDTLNKRGGSIMGEDIDTVEVKDRITYDFTFIDKDPNYKELVFDLITKEFQEQTDKYLANYKPIIANFIRKTENDGEVPMHQNWAFIDEQQHTSVSIWVPLVDSNEDNGTLQMVDGSHKKFGKVRGPLVPWELDKVTDYVVENHLTPMNITAGTAVVLDDSIVHYSNVNATDGLRLAIQLILIPEELPSIHYHMDMESDGKKVKVWEVDKDFYMKFNPWLIPEDVKTVNAVNFKKGFLSKEEFEERLKGPRYDSYVPPKNDFFKNEDTQAQFNKDGYVVLPFLNEDEVWKLKTLFYSLHPELPDQPFYSTSFNPSLDFKKSLSAEVEKIYNDKLDTHFKNIKKLGASFLLKNTGQQGEMPIHQDWTVVDEEQYCSVTIWVPLIDVDETNGAISVLPGSHNYSRVLRSPTLPSIYSEVQVLIRDRMEMLPMKAGEAFIFDHSLLHASVPNLSDQERLALTFGFVPETAEMFLYHKNEKGEVEQLKMPDDFFLRYHTIGQRPDFGKTVATVQANTTPMTAAQFLDLYVEHTLMRNNNLNMNDLTTDIPKTNGQLIMNNHPFFKDPAKQQHFDEKGYAIIDLLDTDDIQDLLGFYSTLNNDHITEHGFHVSLDNTQEGFAQSVIEKLTDVMGKKAENHFEDFQVFTGSYVVKEATPTSVVPPHQDWTFTDETEYQSATLWTPLVDVNEDNGALGVIEGSHKFFLHRRCSPAPQFKAPFDEHLFTVFPYLKVIDLKAGQALVFNNRTIHASPPNVSDSPRIAAGLGITHKDAQLFHSYMLPGSTTPATVEVYEVDQSFFAKYNNQNLRAMYEAGKKPEDLKVVAVEEYECEKISADDLKAMIEAEGNTMNMPLMAKMAKLFNYSMDGTSQNEEENTTNQETQTNQNMTPEKEPTITKQADKVENLQQELATLKAQLAAMEEQEPLHQVYTPKRMLKEFMMRFETSQPFRDMVLFSAIFGVFALFVAWLLGRK